MPETALDDALAAAYLGKLGVDVRPGEVDAAKLAELQRAHITAVPYENVDIVRGHPPGIERRACVERLVAGRGGYCFHLNGAFSLLLEWLGVDLTRHLAGVQGGAAPEPPGPNGNHLGLTVRLAAGDEWLVDAGLGDGPAEPLPLAAGSYRQHGFEFGLGPSPLAPAGWRLTHDPRGSWVLFDMAPGPAVTADFAVMHTKLSTSPESGFVRVVAVMRGAPPSREALRGCVFTGHAGDRVETHDVETRDDWWSLVIDRFGLAYGDLDRTERDRLWRAVRATHEAWDAAGRA